MLLITLQDVPQYLPAFAACGLHRLRISVSADLRISVSIEYQTPANAARGPACLAELQGAGPELRHTREMLARAAAISGSDRAQLNSGVTREEIEQLLDELCWSLRRLARA
jgi:hypothetical protein